MSKGMKILLGVLSGVFVLLVGLFFLVNVVYEPEPEKLIFPDGELSDSIFEGQNNVYTANESLSKTHEFSTVPYKVDVPESKGANIGSGCVYELGGGMFVYVTEFDDMTQVSGEVRKDGVVQMQDILASQFPSALLINYIPEETLVTAEKSADGFINGFTAHYLADSLGITDGTQLVNSALVGYILDVDLKGFEGKHLYVSVGVKDPTNESLSNSAAVLSAVMHTVRYDSELEDAMRLEFGITDEEEVVENTEETADENREDAEVSELSENNQPEVIERNIYNSQEGATFEVNVSWENENYDVILELFLPGGAEFCEPLNQNGTSAKFVLANAPSGDYVMRIKNYQGCGQISSGDEGGSYSDDSYDGYSDYADDSMSGSYIDNTLTGNDDYAGSGVDGSYSSSYSDSGSSYSDNGSSYSDNGGSYELDGPENDVANRY